MFSGVEDSKTAWKRLWIWATNPYHCLDVIDRKLPYYGSLNVFIVNVRKYRLTLK